MRSAEHLCRGLLLVHQNSGVTPALSVQLLVDQLECVSMQLLGEADDICAVLQELGLAGNGGHERIVKTRAVGKHDIGVTPIILENIACQRRKSRNVWVCAGVRVQRCVRSGGEEGVTTGDRTRARE